MSSTRIEMDARIAALPRVHRYSRCLDLLPSLVRVLLACDVFSFLPWTFCVLGDRVYHRQLVRPVGAT